MCRGNVGLIISFAQLMTSLDGWMGGWNEELLDAKR